MFRREDRSGIPFHDDNKYAKSPFSLHTKAQPRLRLRKRHAVLVLCLFAATYLFLKSPSASVSFRSGSSSHAAVPRGGRTVAEQGQAKEKFVVPIPPRKEGGNVDTSGNSNTSNNININSNNNNDKAAAKKQEDKKKKKKKKAPPTLFEFDDKNEKPIFQDIVRSNESKSKGKDSTLNSDAAPPPPPPVAPSVPEAPAPKQQHDWKEIKDGQKEEKNASETDNVDDDTTGGRRLPSYGHDQTSTGSQGNSNSGAYAKNAPIWEERKNRVKEAFVHSWAAYRRDAWGKDEYHPVSKYGSNMIRKGQGFTIVDSLDTILLMGLEDEFEEAKAWVKNELDFDQDGEVNLFETTIRVLGGLLSAYDQSGQDPVFLHKAVDLADRLMGAFETASGIPYASVHLKDRRGVPSHDRGISSTSEVATLQLEFKYLSHLTGDAKYWKAAENVILKIKELDNLDGLVPIYINPYTGNFQGGEIRLGSRGDSYYEYLIKQYLQTGKKEKIYKDMYDHAMGGVKKHLLGRTIPHNLLFVGEISKYEPKNLSPKMDHLVCFLGGTMALGSTEGRSLNDGSQSPPRPRLSIVQEQDFKIGEELTESCYEMYHQTETGLAPEIVYWVQKEEQIRGKSALQHAPGSDFIINDRDGHNWLRPETVESLFYLWRLTGNDKYRHWGWNIFEAIEKYSKVSTGGYSSIHDIRRADVRFSDKMETFFLAETLKYFYLLFGSEEVLPLDKYVFNTEAHPLPIFTPSDELLARTASYRSSSSSSETSPDDKDKDEELSSEDKRYKDLISKEDDQEAVADDEDSPENDEEPLADDDDDANTTEDVEEDVAGPHDSLTSDDTENTNKGSLEDEDEEGDDDVDEVDQGLEDLALDTGEDEEAEVPEVEVDYEDSANEGEADEDTEEDGEEEDGQDGEDGDDGGDGELGTELDVEEEDDEGEEPDEEDEDEEEEEDDFSVEVGGDGYGVVKPEDWEGKDGEEGEEKEEKEENQPSYNDHGLL
ncbi:mannosyl-oligosaccharide alpha-1,2-mannosidase [Mortierella alpina]|nr:mannosyl-oligosaccharide alpha-1,2-mannosidase [Mortierella alpina]